MHKIHVLTFLLAVLMAACSTRQVYEASTEPTPPSANTININTATAAELEKLPHIGRKTAEAIVAYREENGPFRRVEHLMLIKGVSEKRFAELRPLLRTE